MNSNRLDRLTALQSRLVKIRSQQASGSSKEETQANVNLPAAILREIHGEQQPTEEIIESLGDQDVEYEEESESPRAMSEEETNSKSLHTNNQNMSNPIVPAHVKRVSFHENQVVNQMKESNSIPPPKPTPKQCDCGSLKRTNERLERENGVVHKRMKKMTDEINRLEAKYLEAVKIINKLKLEAGFAEELGRQVLELKKENVEKEAQRKQATQLSRQLRHHLNEEKQAKEEVEKLYVSCRGAKSALERRVDGLQKRLDACDPRYRKRVHGSRACLCSRHQSSNNDNDDNNNSNNNNDSNIVDHEDKEGITNHENTEVSTPQYQPIEEDNINENTQTSQIPQFRLEVPSSFKVSSTPTRKISPKPMSSTNKYGSSKKVLPTPPPRMFSRPMKQTMGTSQIHQPSPGRPMGSGNTQSITDEQLVHFAPSDPDTWLADSLLPLAIGGSNNGDLTNSNHQTSTRSLSGAGPITGSLAHLKWVEHSRPPQNPAAKQKLRRKPPRGTPSRV